MISICEGLLCLGRCVNHMLNMLGEFQPPAAPGYARKTDPSRFTTKECNPTASPNDVAFSSTRSFCMVLSFVNY